MKYIILGRTGSGKSELRYIMQNMHGIQFAKSHTTRPQRGADDDNYHFISKEEAAAIPPENKLFPTIIGDHEYFLTQEEIEKAGAIVLEPDGLFEILEKMPDITFEVVYLHAEKPDRQAAALKRVSDTDREKEKHIFENRDKSEDERFTKLENIFQKSELPGNLIGHYWIENDYKAETLLNCADYLHDKINQYANLHVILKDMEQLKLVERDEDGKILITVVEKDNDSEEKETRTEHLTEDTFINLCLHDGKALNSILYEWLATKNCVLRSSRYADIYQLYDNE